MLGIACLFDDSLNIDAMQLVNGRAISVVISTLNFASLIASVALTSISRGITRRCQPLSLSYAISTRSMPSPPSIGISSLFTTKGLPHASTSFVVFPTSSILKIPLSFAVHSSPRYRLPSTKSGRFVYSVLCPAALLFCSSCRLSLSSLSFSGLFFFFFFVFSFCSSAGLSEHRCQCRSAKVFRFLL